MKHSLDLALIGNCQVGALIDTQAEIVWYCLPRFDGDPVFCSLLQEHELSEGLGYCSIELVDQVASEQNYLANSAVLVTQMTDSRGGVVEVTDFAPRFRQYGRIYTPIMLVRQVRRLHGTPRIVIRVRPARNYGAERGEYTYGSHHIRYVSPYMVLRLSTDASVTAILQELPVVLDDEVNLVFGPDETVQESVSELARRFKAETLAYWQEWVRDLGIPFEWQDEVIRAAITLKLNAFEDTGAIAAALTTSIPEAPDSGRNWDYRYCWLRDAYFVVNALNRLGATKTMERYLRYLVNVVAGSDGGYLQPVYGIDGNGNLEEKEMPSLPGYRGMGPVRVGNQACLQVQHDVYGSAVLAVTHVFFDHRLMQRGDVPLFQRLEPLGEMAIQVHDQPDAGLWELRGSRRVHTFSSIMCWAACDRLAKIAERLGLRERAAYWEAQAQRIHETVCRRGWNEEKKSFTAAFEGETLDASLLLMHDVGFLAADDPRFAATVAAIERELRRGDYIFRYVEEDDFGAPQNAFIVCTYWYIYALVALGRTEEARRLFENLLAHHNRHGLMAEHVDVATGEQWGNFVQTYSMVGLINAAIRLSKRWDTAF
ncbi:glycoside hydrolase family 15 protein [Geomonas nitrogeniifigens]|uniref:Glycoside hydrolase family 15 protein n=1 Tax=Geomonas diazotrophica TaxID=2843197 RepID=A0ABX8JEP2_9BACT|nr:glycoside hydrolase family 15 protein [Geomonas nitrogeniifigens]QWV96456.1 glycoside hydrolase family 15 protein [Geomonas nitrogeniifigens]QXE86459.1 glycoside hydrolase family 15 protein [Geomonas nitrogeniifigens]